MNYYGLWRRANAAVVTSVTEKSGQTMNWGLTPISWF
jgi:hypothetical protein